MTKSATKTTKKTAAKKKAPAPAPPPPLAVAHRQGRDGRGRPYELIVRVAGLTVNGQEMPAELAADAIAGALAQSLQRWKTQETPNGNH